MKKQGKISVTAENIFPIIRQWLYSSQDIFLREIISNAADAITKRQHLANLGKVEKYDEEPQIEVVLNTKENTLTVSDNGIGMSADEVNKYINEIAYSGLVDFVEKYQDQSDSGAQIIGHFGLGFYSSFMVADKVEIDSKSCFTENEAVHWLSEEGIEYQMQTSDKAEIGTDIIMHLTEEAIKEYNEFKIRETILKYCQFMSYPIYFSVISDEEETDADEDKATEDEREERKPINNPDPLWNKNPNEVEDQEYIDFYHELFPGMDEPLFWVHLNLDYPFRLKGILYFPSTDVRYENLEGRIKVFYNQVFVADNVPEIIPEFLFLLKGCIDCPDLPLNVSRSFLQDDQYVKKLSGHIVKKVADRLVKVSKDEPEQYQAWWKYLQLFIKYGMMRDQKFADRVYDIALLENTEHEFTYLKDFNIDVSDSADNTENQIEKIYYIDEENTLSPYVALAQKQDKQVYLMTEDIDVQWMSFIEYQSQGKLKFVRVDAESDLDAEDAKETELDQKTQDEFIEQLKKLDQDNYHVKFQHSGTDALPLMIRENEEYRRMKDLLEQIERAGDEQTLESYKSMFAGQENKQTLIVNLDQPIFTDGVRQNPELISYLLKLAKLGQGELKGSEFIEFLEESANYAFKGTEDN
ncbi:MAG: molecular chaperone HtpG [Clostridiaceae bacterium]|nr:molecular chaperone HtpG [Clostridiaceae bacterium]